MPVRVVCPHCAAACSIPDEARGQVVRCPRCQKPFRTASPPSSVTAVAQPERPLAVPAEAVTAEPTKVSVPPARPEQENRDELDEDGLEKPAGQPEARKGNSRRRLLLGVSAVAIGLIARVRANPRNATATLAGGALAVAICAAGLHFGSRYYDAHAVPSLQVDAES